MIILDFIKIVGSSFIASLGFAIIFNIRGNKVFVAAIAGSIGSCIHYLMIQNGVSSMLSLFLASMGFSLYSEVCARKLKTPVTTFVVCGLIPLVPGAGMYYCMVEAINSRVMEALEIGLKTVSEAGSLALGIIFAATLTRMWVVQKNRYHKKRSQI